ncbi:MAG: hypothetical protein SA339_11950 [Methanomassiliicoccus sp.]|nr:hypothetical protein [Methanomassiliicoccus sp.]
MEPLNVVLIMCEVCGTPNEVNVEKLKGRRSPRCCHCGCPLKGLL